MGKLIKRFGGYIYNVRLIYETVGVMDWEHYKKKLAQYEKQKVVYVVPIDCWVESDLFGFFIKAFKELGFEKYLVERTPEYMKLKERMKFYGFPDFLVMKNGKWERLEMESFSSSFKLHPPDYAEYLLCFDETIKIPRDRVQTFTVREFFGCQEIINLEESPEFLYLYDQEFKKDYHKRSMKSIVSKMKGKTYPKEAFITN